MGETFDLLSGLSGFLVGFLVVAIVFYFFIKSGKKKRLFDERYHQVHNKARSLAWQASTLGIIAAWIYALLAEGPGVAFFLLTFVYAAHMISYCVSALVLDKKL